MTLEPHLPKGELQFLTGFFRSNTIYLEYGSGGSTLAALDRGVRPVVSVESDPIWFDRTSDSISESDRSRIDLLLVDIGPTRDWGWPASNDYFPKWPDYSLSPWRHCQHRSVEPNLVLIDGRFRVACFCATLLFGKPGTTILFDDYIDRPQYHVVQKIIQPKKSIGRLCEFQIPRRLKRSQIRELTKLFLESAFDPA